MVLNWGNLHHRRYVADGPNFLWHLDKHLGPVYMAV